MATAHNICQQSRHLLRLPTALGATSSTSLLIRRCLNTTVPRPYQQQKVPKSLIPIPSPTAKDDGIPPYPYGPRRIYHQSNTGLYGLQRIRFGNNVSPKYHVVTPRKWRPNVQPKRLWSESLGVFVRTRLTTRVLRTIDKCGGLDAYLLGNKPRRVKELGPWGWRLRWRVMQTPMVRQRMNAERARLGLVHTAEDPAGSRDEWDRIVDEGRSAGTTTTTAPVTPDEFIAETDAMLARGDEVCIGEAAVDALEHHGASNTGTSL